MSFLPSGLASIYFVVKCPFCSWPTPWLVPWLSLTGFNSFCSEVLALFLANSMAIVDWLNSFCSEVM